MNKTILLTIIVFLLSISIASADLDTGLVSYYTCDTANVNSTHVNDVKDTHHGVIYNTIVTNVDAIAGTSCDFDTNDYANITTGEDEMEGDAGLTINFWVKIDTLTGTQGIVSKFYDGADRSSAVIMTGSNWAARISTNTQNDNDQAAVAATAGQWAMVTAMWNTTGNIYIYRNGSSTSASQAQAGATVRTNNLNMMLGMNPQPGLTNPFAGLIDEIGIWNRSLSEAEIDELFQNGAGNPYSNFTPTVPQNESMERTSQISQGAGFIQVSSATYQNITSGTVIVTNASDAYVTSTFETQGITSGSATCRLLFGGTDYTTNATRTFSAGSYGSWYLSSSNFSVAEGNYTATLQCRREAGIFRVRNAEILTHQLIDEENETVNHKFVPVNLGVSTDDYSLLLSDTFTVSTRNESGAIKYLVMDMGLVYNYNVTGNMTILPELNGNNCSEMPRYGASGSIGSTAIYCVAKNVSTGTVDFRIFGKGSGTVNGTAVIKEFELDEPEVNFTGLNNTAVTSSSFQNLKSITVNNIDHATANLIVKATIPSISNSSSAESVYRLVIASQNGTQIQRTFSAQDQPGVTILQDSFSSLGLGAQTVTLQGQCSNSNCSIIGGNLIAYYADDLDFIANNFNVTAYDDFNGSQILNFNVTVANGNVFSTSTGIVTVTPSILLENLVIQADDYINLSVSNHNTTGNLNVTIYQAAVCFNSTEKVSGLLATANNFTIGDTVRSTCFNLTADVHNVMAQKTGWFNRNQSFNVTARSVVNLTVENMTYANFTVYARNERTGAYLSGYTLNISSVNYSGWGGEGYANVTNYSFSLINETFTVSIDADGYSLTNATVNVTVAGHTNYTFLLREFNTLNITVYNETSNTVLNVSVNIDIIQSNQTTNLSTSNGTLYVQDLTTGEIEIRYDDAGTATEGRVYFLTLSNRSYQEIRLYLLDTGQSDLIVFDLVDQDGQDLEDAIVKAQRFYPGENLYRTIAMTKSNFNGQGSIDLVKKATQANVFYKFIVEVGGVVKEETNATEINPTGSDILYFTIDVLEDIFTSFDGMDNVGYNLTYSNATNQFTFVWSDTSGLVRDGCLKVIRHTPLQQFTICDDCTASTSATLVCNITNTGDLYKAVGMIETTTNNSLYTVAALSWNFDTKYQTFGTYGVFLAILFIGTLAGVGVWNPIVSVVLTLVALVFTTILGMINFAYVSIVALVIVGAIAIAKMRT